MEIGHLVGRVLRWSGFGGMAAGPGVWGGCGGVALGEVRMVPAMALVGVPLGSSVVFILGIRPPSGGSWADGVAGLLVFFTCTVLPLIISCIWLL